LVGQLWRSGGKTAGIGKNDCVTTGAGVLGVSSGVGAVRALIGQQQQTGNRGGVGKAGRFAGAGAAFL
jgi:tetrahydrodipicolinate N-succinyltransferase